jgi:MFS family permease
MNNVLHMTPAEIGSVYAVLLFANQILALPAGMMGDRWGFRLPMVLGCLTDAASYLILAFSTSGEGAYIAAVGIGLGGCLFSTNARAELLSYTRDDKSRTARVQGEFLRWTNIGALLGPLLGFAVLKSDMQRAPFLMFAAVELLLLVPIALEMSARPRGSENDAAPVPSNVPSPSSTYWRQFVMLHFLAAIPVGLAASTPVVFPYIFDTILHRPADNSIAQLLQNLVIIVLQTWFSVRLLSTSRIKTSLVMSGVLLFCLIGLATFATSSGWLFALSGLFGICQVIATTAVYNGVIFMGTPKGKAAAFGLSKLVLAISTFCILKSVPLILYAWQRLFECQVQTIVSFLCLMSGFTLFAIFFRFVREREA